MVSVFGFRIEECKVSTMGFRICSCEGIQLCSFGACGAGLWDFRALGPMWVKQMIPIVSIVVPVHFG